MRSTKAKGPWVHHRRSVQLADGRFLEWTEMTNIYGQRPKQTAGYLDGQPISTVELYELLALVP